MQNYPCKQKGAARKYPRRSFLRMKNDTRFAGDVKEEVPGDRGESGIWFFSRMWEEGRDSPPSEYLDDRNLVRE